MTGWAWLGRSGCPTHFSTWRSPASPAWRPQSSRLWRLHTLDGGTWKVWRPQNLMVKIWVKSCWINKNVPQCLMATKCGIPWCSHFSTHPELAGPRQALQKICQNTCLSWLVVGFAIVPEIQIIQGPSNVWKAHYCGKKSWETDIFRKKNVWVKKPVFWKKNRACLPFPKRIRSLIKPLLKNSFSTNFQGTGPWEGPIHFSRFVLRVHNCSKLFQSWSWS